VWRGAALVALTLGVGVLAAPTRAQAAPCGEPRTSWQTATPAEQGLDASQLARALHSYQDRRAYAVRIYRNGCLVARDTNGGDSVLYESWEITSSVVALVAAFEMSRHLLSPDDVVGALVPEADKQHGAITVRELLQRSSGLRYQPDNIYLRDRLRLALTRPLSDPPGHAFGDAPVARALLVTVLERAAKEGIESYLARELFAPLGIRRWHWTRDRAGQPVGTFGLQLTSDDLARLGELLRREGRWEGRQLIDASYLQDALTPSPHNPCMGWLIWVNVAHGCSGTPQRLLPGLPRDLWSWAGYGDQRVTGIPSLGLLVVRYGAAAGDPREGVDGLTWERDVLRQLLAAVRDTTVPDEGDRNDLPPGIGTTYMDNLTSGWAPLPALPGAGPRRTRVPQVRPYREKAGKKRLLSVRVSCPAVPGRGCAGSARLIDVSSRERRWSAPAGETTTVTFRLRSRLRAARAIDVQVHAEDEADGVTTGTTLHARR
jgi:CubicO group peptidase (beta-lactamase class C family)